MNKPVKAPRCNLVNCAIAEFKGEFSQADIGNLRPSGGTVDRDYLEDLENQGLIEKSSIRPGRGRDIQLWRKTALWIDPPKEACDAAFGRAERAAEATKRNRKNLDAYLASATEWAFGTPRDIEANAAQIALLGMISGWPAKRTQREAACA